jgi:CheY-like chemotaxis protein
MASIADVHVLLVDDNRQMRQLLRSMLHAVGVRHIVEADSAASALRALHGLIDLVILDWQMAPIDGLELARAIRNGEGCPRPFVPIIMLTAHTEIHRVAAARDAGVNGFVKKPVSATLLLSRISNTLTDRRLFVRCASFIGPDRRHGAARDFRGPFRRETDRKRGADTFDLDDLPLSA